MLDEPAHVYACYDIFIDGCDEARKAQIDENLEEPIHCIEKKSSVYHVFRAKRLDKKVARWFDKGSAAVVCRF
jgi:hypothetical protein